VTEISEEKIIEITETTDQNFKEIVMSTYDRILTKGIDLGIEKGIEQGIDLGIEKGFEKAMKKAVLNGYDKGLSITMLCNINELSEEYVLKVLRENGRMK
jgi:flagellar biosynthesis/type III secretory pathway protein FliH